MQSFCTGCKQNSVSMKTNQYLDNKFCKHYIQNDCVTTADMQLFI